MGQLEKVVQISVPLFILCKMGKMTGLWGLNKEIHIKHLGPCQALRNFHSSLDCLFYDRCSINVGWNNEWVNCVGVSSNIASSLRPSLKSQLKQVLFCKVTLSQFVLFSLCLTLRGLSPQLDMNTSKCFLLHRSTSYPVLSTWCCPSLST